jgi:hypothetical protein
MKRFLVFAYDGYYPTGGWGDFVKDFNTEEEALEEAKKTKNDIIEIVDTEIGKVIKWVQFEILFRESEGKRQKRMRIFNGDSSSPISDDNLNSLISEEWFPEKCY